MHGFCQNLSCSRLPYPSSEDSVFSNSLLTSKPSFALRLVKARFNSSVRSSLQDDLSFLRILYPNGGEWLDKTLRSASTDIECHTFVTDKGERAGVAITKKKSNRETKISTFYVAPRFRKLGVGKLALRMLLEDFFQKDVDRVHITHCKNTIEGFQNFLNSVTVWDNVEAPERYFADKTEVVSIAQPDSMRLKNGKTNGVIGCL